MTEEVLENEGSAEETVADENSLVCILTGKAFKDNEKEKNLQSLIRMMNEEYGFELAQMERDYTLAGEDAEGKKLKRKLDLVVFDDEADHEPDNAIRLCLVTDSKTKETDKKKGVEAIKECLSLTENCAFGLWTNGLQLAYLKIERGAMSDSFVDLADFPGEGEQLDDLNRQERAKPRTPANDSLIKTFKRCHDYIYGNAGINKTAFWELLNLIFCKIYDEKEALKPRTDGHTYRRRFWVGLLEKNTEEGCEAISERIKGLFEELKNEPLFQDVFVGNERINLGPKHLAFVAGELAKYSFLDATVDVKGMAYETIVSNTLKQERGQFFTPRNIVKLMVAMLNPQPNERLIDPSCGSGGFLVTTLDHVRRQIAQELFPDLEGPWLEARYNDPEVNRQVTEYAETYLFGIDFDIELKRAARMNMVMAGDGHANIFHLNSLEYPRGDFEDIDTLHERLAWSIEQAGDSADLTPEAQYDDTAHGKFDLIFTNPPFGAKIPINDPDILAQYELGYNYKRNASGQWDKVGLASSQPPEILFIDRCYQLLKEGGRMAIVLPDGILGNPNTEYVRAWILERFKVLASVDLPVEAFLPQVGVQASLLFLKKRTQAQRNIFYDGDEAPYDVFMAIAEKVGKDRRGVPIYERDEDGAEILTEKTVRYLHHNRKTGTPTERQRTEKTPDLADDLPRIGRAYYQFLKGELR